MLRNYITATLRNLLRNKLYAAINIIGLAVGFTAAMLIAIFVRDELTFDTWIPGYEDVYRLSKDVNPPGGAPLSTDGSGPAEAAWFASDVPEVRAVTRLWPEQRPLRQGDVEAIEAVAWVDPNFFEVFPLPIVEGVEEGALSSPDAAVLTRAMAHKYFGTDQVVGRTLEIDRAHVLHITAVLDDLPSRSHLNLGFLFSSRASFSPTNTTEGVTRQAIGFGPLLTYLRIAPGGLEKVRRAAPGLLDVHTPGINLQQGEKAIPTSAIVTYDFQPLARIHMIPQTGRTGLTHFGLLRSSGDPGVVTALLITGVLILFVAIANFVNLMSARAPRRATEIGVRKTVGARRRDLMIQFLGESVLYVAISIAIAILAVASLLPAVGGLLDRDVEFAGDPLVLTGAAAGALILTALLGGLYPAFLLSRLRPASALKAAGPSSGGAGVVREILVVAQFAILIGLLVTTLTIAQQTAFITHNALRSDTDQFLFAGSPCTDAFRTQVSSLPGVRGAACVSSTFFGGTGAVGLTASPDGSRFNLRYTFVDPDALELFGLTPLAGRFFRPGDEKIREGATARVGIINETAARKLGYISPEAAIGRIIEGRNVEIIGVVRDFPIRTLSPRDPIEAFAFYPVGALGGMSRMDPSQLLIKIDGARIGETVTAIDAIWETLDVDRPIIRKFLNQHVEDQYRDLTRQTDAFNVFSLASVFIACLGLFGLSAHRAESRTKEIGIRKTMGASSADVLRLLLWQFTRPVLWANAIAWPVAYFIMQRWLEGFAYRIELAPWMFIAASAATLGIALLTVIGHALLVARAHPVSALRYE